MFTRLALIFFVMFLVSSVSFGGDKKPIALTGVDPVSLVSGKPAKGHRSLSALHGRFTYLFASKSDRQTFLNEPSRYAVQIDGKCAMMPEMAGDPDLYMLYKGRIYLAGNDTCM